MLRAGKPNGYFSPLDCGVLPQPSRHDEQNSRDGKKRRHSKLADAVRQDVDCDCETNNHHSQPKRRESQQQSPGENFLAWLAK